jgi:hypothetical protein
MAVNFSNLLGADGTADVAIEVGKRAAPGQYGAVLKVVRAFCTFTPVASEVSRMFTLPSGSRIYQLYFATSDWGGASTAHVGLHKAGSAHDGAVIDNDLFGSSIDVGTADVARTEILNEATTITDLLRGDYLWKMADAGAATLTTDPFEDWDFTVTVATTASPVSSTMTLEAWYV